MPRPKKTVDGAAFGDYLNFKRSQGISRRDAFGNTGVHCPACRYTHPYTGPEDKRLATEYEKRENTWVLIWLCPLTGDKIGELWLGNNRVNTETAE